MKLQVMCLGAIAATGAVMAQDVPAPVIEQCQQIADARELPDCLGEGAVGYILLQRVSTDAYFGSAILPVVEICQEQNDTFASAWTCVAEAASTAVETAALIPRELISDPCVQALAEPGLVTQLSSERRDLRSHFRPSTSFFGGTMFSLFRGCPEPQAQEAPLLDNSGLSTSECTSIAALEDFLAERSSAELRAIIPVLNLLPEEGRLAALADFGLSANDIDIIASRMGRSDSDAMGMMFLGLGLLARHHEELVSEVLEMSQSDNDIADAFASGFMTMLTGAALDGYEASCAP